MSDPLVVGSAVAGHYSEEEITYLVRAFVTLGKHDQDEDEIKKEIIDITKHQLTDEKQLRGGLCILKEFPRNNTGKIDRRALHSYKIEKC
jgi:acyl-coenzyme A synthetase/AMP-(fatty) acid ligase